MHPLRHSVLALALVTAIPVFADDGSLPVVGLDDEGASIEETLPPSVLQKRYRAVLGSVHDSLLPALRSSAAHAPWQLRTVVVGVGIGAELGIGPLLKVKASPRFRAVFSNGSEPILP